MTNKAPNNAIIYTIYTLIVISFIVVLGFYDYRQVQDDTVEDVNSESSASSSEASSDTDLSQEDKALISALETIQPTKSQATIDELIADLPAGIDINSPGLFVVNPDQPYEEDPDPILATDPSGAQYSEMVAEPFDALKTAASEAGYDLVLVSAYRSIEEQEAIRESMMNMYLNSGLSETEAEVEVDKYIAPTYASEHSTGMAVDIVDSEWYALTGNGLIDEYADQPSAVWLEENADDYGWILRYPDGKDKFTGYSYEPWHYRYVGRPHSQYMHKHGLTLEEYVLLAQERERRGE